MSIDDFPDLRLRNTVVGLVQHVTASLVLLELIQPTWEPVVRLSEKGRLFGGTVCVVRAGARDAAWVVTSLKTIAD